MNVSASSTDAHGSPDFSAIRSNACTTIVNGVSTVFTGSGTKIYDKQNTLIETDVTNYTMTASNVISLSSASAQTQSGMLTVTVQ